MANNNPNFRTADELIRSWFQAEAAEFESGVGELGNFKDFVEEWVLAAYLQGHEDGYEQGHDEGFQEGYDDGEAEGNINSYDDGYDDARAEFDNDW